MKKHDPASEWHRFQVISVRHFVTALGAALGLRTDSLTRQALLESDGPYRFAESEIQQLKEIYERFRSDFTACLTQARVLDSTARLRLVIDNTRAELGTGR